MRAKAGNLRTKIAARLWRKPPKPALWILKWSGLLVLSWLVGLGLLSVLIGTALMRYAVLPAELSAQTRQSCDVGGTRHVLSIETARIGRALYMEELLPLPALLETPAQVWKTSWIELRRQLQNAAEDDTVAAVMIDYQGVASGRTGLQRLTNLLAEFRDQSDKPVWVFGHHYGFFHGIADYLLAHPEHHIMLAPSGRVEFTHLAREQFYFKRFLDHWGIVPEVTRRHEYKAASSIYDHTGPRPAEIENLTALLRDVEAASLAIVHQRVDDVDALFATGIFAAPAAEQVGLVDALVYRDELPQSIQDRFGEDVTMLPLACYYADLPPARDAKQVQIVNIIGAILPPSNTSRQQSSSPQTALANIAQARDNDAIDGLLVYIESPGGDYAMSERLWHALHEFPKPVAVLMGDVAASGGYFIAVGGDKIFAYPQTITGSIGIFSWHLATREFFEDRLKIDPHHLSHSSRSFSSFLDVYPEQYRRNNDKFIDVLYGDFLQKVSLGRGISVKDLDAVARGRVFAGSPALERALIDGTGGLADAAQWLEQELSGEIIFVPEQYQYGFDRLIEEFVSTAIESRLQSVLYRAGITGGVRAQMPLIVR